MGVGLCAGPGTSRGVNRVHLTEQNREVLVKLCVVRRMQFSYKKGTKTPFWNKIRALLWAEIDKDPKNPDITIRQLVNERRAVVAMQKIESGTVQTDTELDHNLDLWIERENELLREQEDAKKPKEVLQREALQAAIHRDNLLVSHSRKRYYSSGSSDDKSDCTEAILPTAGRGGCNCPGSDNQKGTSVFLIPRRRLRKGFKGYNICTKNPGMRITKRKTRKSIPSLLIP